MNSYAETAISLFVPELERGLFDDNWRIRYSSVLLLGELLFKVSGVTGKATTESVDEDDNFGTEYGLQSITHSLGRERRDRVLSGKHLSLLPDSIQTTFFVQVSTWVVRILL